VRPGLKRHFDASIKSHVRWEYCAILSLDLSTWECFASQVRLVWELDPYSWRFDPRVDNELTRLKNVVDVLGVEYWSFTAWKFWCSLMFCAWEQGACKDEMLFPPMSKLASIAANMTPTGQCFMLSRFCVTSISKFLRGGTYSTLAHAKRQGPSCKFVHFNVGQPRTFDVRLRCSTRLSNILKPSNIWDQLYWFPHLSATHHFLLEYFPRNLDVSERWVWRLWNFLRFFALAPAKHVRENLANFGWNVMNLIKVRELKLRGTHHSYLAWGRCCHWQW